MTGNVDIEGTLNVDGITTFNSNVTVNANLLVQNDLDVDGMLNVEGDSNFIGEVTVGNLVVENITTTGDDISLGCLKFSDADLTINSSGYHNIIEFDLTGKRVAYFDARVVAKKDSGTKSTAAYRVQAAYENDGGTITQIRNDVKTIFEFNGAGESNMWNVRTAISGTKVIFEVRGNGSDVVDWRICAERTEL